MKLQDEILKIADLSAQNINMIQELNNVSHTIEEFEKLHPEYMNAVLEAKMKLTLQQLKQSRENLNDLGTEIDKSILRTFLKNDPQNAYRSVEASRMIATAETDKKIRLLFPANAYEKSAKVIWHPKGYIRPTQDQNGIIINYYPDWKFSVFEADPVTGKVPDGTVPEVIDCVDFIDIVNLANERLSYEPLTVGKRNLLPSRTNIKPKGISL